MSNWNIATEGIVQKEITKESHDYTQFLSLLSTEDKKGAQTAAVISV
jgi:hypothetical protein